MAAPSQPVVPDLWWRALGNSSQPAERATRQDVTHQPVPLGGPLQREQRRLGNGGRFGLHDGVEGPHFDDPVYV